MTLLVLKGALFSLLLLIAALWDLKKREIPDAVPALILACGLLSCRPGAAALGLITTGLPYFLAAVLSSREGLAIGGGDIKLMAACGFVLGVGGGLLQSILSLLLIVLAGTGTAVRRKCKLNNVKMPLAPFFCAGGVFAYAAVAAASI